MPPTGFHVGSVIAVLDINWKPVALVGQEITMFLPELSTDKVGGVVRSGNAFGPRA